MKIGKNTAGIIVVLLPLLIITFLYNQVFFHPSDFMFSNDGDGIKNYYSLAWFLDHNSSWIDHSGMNYPYGEHYIFTDGFAPIGWLFKALGISGNTAIGFVNFLMIFSVVPSSYFLFKILRIFKVETLIAILAATAIAFMSPQFSRMAGHYSLSISFFFPLSLWLLIDYIHHIGSWKKTLVIFANTLLWLLVHPYLGVIIISFYLANWLFQSAVHWQKIANRKTFLFQTLVQTILPVAILQIFISLTDTHLMRPDKPSGFWDFSASLKSIFLPDDGPLIFINSLFNSERITWEGMSYIGIGTVLFIIYYLLKSFTNMTRFRNEIVDENRFDIYLIPAVIVLIFSFGFPFYQFPWLVDIAKPIRSFRALGRFAWVFYYVATLLSIIKVNEWFSSNKNYRLPILTSLILLLFIESIGGHWKFAHQIQSRVNYFKLENIDSEFQTTISSINKDDYLAILPLPYFHVGSERFSVSTQHDGPFNTMVLSYHLGLPILANELARTSLIETKKSMMIVAPNYYPKDICDDLDAGNLLIVNSKGALTKSEKYILNRSTTISSSDRMALSNISVDRICESIKSITIDLNKLHRITPDLFVDSTNTYVEFIDYRQRAEQELTFNSERTIIKEFSPSEIDVGDYQISIWYRVNEKETPSYTFFLETKNKDGSDGKWEYFETLDKKSIFSGDSILFRKNFSILDKDRQHSIIMKAPKREVPNVRLLDVLIHHKNTNLYRVKGDSISVNNHRMMPLHQE